MDRWPRSGRDASPEDSACTGGGVHGRLLMLLAGMEQIYKSRDLLRNVCGCTSNADVNNLLSHGLPYFPESLDAELCADCR